MTILARHRVVLSSLRRKHKNSEFLNRTRGPQTPRKELYQGDSARIDHWEFEASPTRMFNPMWVL